ncbi:MAG: DUF1579 family protein [Gemmatimonadales bacterium]
MHANRSRASLAALVLASTGLVAPSGLSAQGTLDQAWAPATTPTASTRQPAVQPARSLLHQLVGRWRFAIWFAGNFDGPPDATGTRTIEGLYDDLRLQWSEQLDSSASQSQGVLGFDPRTGQFYSSAVYSAGTGVEILTGVLNLAEPLVTFTPVSAPGGAAPSPARRLMESFTLTLIDRDHFTWAPLDRGWRAVFTREP